MNQITAPKTTVTVSKTFPDRLADAGNVILTRYAVVLDKQQKTIGVKISQLAAGAAGCLFAGALFGTSYGKDAGFIFALLAGLVLGAAVTFLWVCYQASKRPRSSPKSASNPHSARSASRACGRSFNKTENMINIGSAIRGIQAMKKNRVVSWGVDFGMFGFFLELWTPTWHDGRGPYFVMGVGIIKISRGY